MLKYEIVLVFMHYGELIERSLGFSKSYKVALHRALHAKFTKYILEEGELASPCSVYLRDIETNEKTYMR